ncbi:MAG: tRNA uridine-5-carboxymethylaminomethyl(34) synthesis GTPase MnmE [Pyrinomonadaceae bacterium]
MITIVALSTPPGRGGIGVVRLSGPAALNITRLLVSDSHFDPQPNHAALKKLVDPKSSEVLDTALVTYFRAPHSFTGEDVVEFSCHGSPVLLRRVIACALDQDARVAKPGEFTLRALTNGRLNLSQAEAIRDLIDAQTEAGARQAARQMQGELSAFLQPMKDRLLSIIVLLESALEFVEDDLPAVAIVRVQTDLTALEREVGALAATFRSGRLVRDGIKVALAGRPNVGKSSLFNRLLSSDRAIVTDIPGTTRDSLSEFVNIHGVPVYLTDTAGLRTSGDVVEQLGVERTRQAMADAELVIVVLDGSAPLTAEDESVLADAAAGATPFIIAMNKSDVPGFNCSLDNARGSLAVSALTGDGLDQLRQSVIDAIGFRDTDAAGLLITTARHFDLLQRTAASLGQSRGLLDQRASEELTLVGLHNALRFLGEITGETTSDEILGQIFATFCIGK